METEKRLAGFIARTAFIDLPQEVITIKTSPAPPLSAQPKMAVKP